MSSVSLAAEIIGAVRIPSRRKKRVVVVAGMDIDAIRKMQAQLAKLKARTRRKNVKAWKRIKADPGRLAKQRARGKKWEAENPEKRKAARARYRKRNLAYVRKSQREWARTKAAERSAA